MPTPRSSPQERIAALERALRAGSLPGDAAKRRMWPAHLPARPAQVDPADARLAAVLILLYAEADRVCFPLIRRTEVTGDAHSGQISLPGGSREPTETPEQTALREAREELGIDPTALRVIGRLSQHFIPVSGFRVMPVVTVAPRPPIYRADPQEVAQLLVTSLEELEAPGSASTFRRDFLDATHEIPCWRLDGEAILWGATAMILAELLALAAPGRGEANS